MNNKELVDQFIELVKIDSPSGEEDSVQKYLAKKLEGLEFECAIDSAGNIIARNNVKGESVLVGAHMDTVEPGRGIKPQIKNGYITSDGTTILGADNKATVAAILFALEKSKSNLRSLELVFTVREETDGGINDLDFTKLESKTGVVADSVASIGIIIESAPWIEDINIVVSGLAAHASQPKKGINALLAAAKAISTMPLGHVNENTIANIGLISGGDATNTIPAMVHLKGEIRSFNRDDFENTKKQIEEHFIKVAEELNAKATVEHKFYGDGYTHNRKAKAMVDILSVYGEIGVEADFIKSYGASDANIYVSNGVNIVNIGDGVEEAHTVRERISVANLRKLSEFFTAYFMLN